MALEDLLATLAGLQEAAADKPDEDGVYRCFTCKQWLASDEMGAFYVPTVGWFSVCRECSNAKTLATKDDETSTLAIGMLAKPTERSGKEEKKEEEKVVVPLLCGYCGEETGELVEIDSKTVDDAFGGVCDRCGDVFLRTRRREVA